MKDAMRLIPEKYFWNEIYHRPPHLQKMQDKGLLMKIGTHGWQRALASKMPSEEGMV
jgi:hypothetical protein